MKIKHDLATKIGIAIALVAAVVGAVVLVLALVSFPL